MRLTKIIAASIVSMSLATAPALAAEKSVAKQTVKADVRKASKLRGVSRQEEEKSGSGTWIVAGLAIVAVGLGIAAAVSGDSSPTSP
ncbi:hypothetical protein M9980_07530 [Sphingomonas donggukensis]|uniref:Secreted protein n=1 Tax=Sphingomonas donggukensis TaxID=2949093 RepID=A0ABY4TPX6_9SPHN|nr:hypothetical protein [Sphingomonas donggukensis]URW74438.1 hypothetical protein M9980_07530 [Sphingomonas donggukensis]